LDREEVVVDRQEIFQQQLSATFERSLECRNVLHEQKTLKALQSYTAENHGEKIMFDFTSTLMWVLLGVGIFALAVAEYRFSSKKARI
jgi:hypothetical protein